MTNLAILQLKTWCGVSSFEPMRKLVSFQKTRKETKTRAADTRRLVLVLVLVIEKPPNRLRSPATDRQTSNSLSVTAPLDADVTALAYFASTPRVYRGLGAFQAA